MENWEIIWKEADVHTTVHELLERTRKVKGTALDICGETMTFSEFHDRSDAFAAWLQARGYGRGENGSNGTIILSMKVTVDLFCMIMAAVKAGVVVTVTEDTITRMRLTKLYEQTKAVARITDDQIEMIYDEGKDLPLKRISDEFRPTDVYAIWYTSGSTGEPCGIQTMSYNTVCSIAPVPGNEILSTCLKECSALLSIGHPSFCFGFTNFVYPILYGKKFVYIQPGQENSIREITKKILENRGCFLMFTPSAVTACLKEEETRRSLANCKAIMMGADMVKSSLIAEVQKAMGPEGKVVNLYGSSDVGLLTSKITRADDKPHAVGKVTACTEMKVVDGNRNPLPPGELGELCVTGLRVGPGYLRAEPEKMNKFVYGKDGMNWFFTGDYGYIDEDGEVYMLGRTDRLIKHLGYRVDSVELEEAIKREAHVKEAAVKQFETERGQVLCAFYENDVELDPSALRNTLAEVLPRYCIPERFIFRKALPLTERGKLDYKALVLPEAELAEATYAAPRTPKEEVLCEAFEKCLKTGRPVGRNDSFFELGGDSITGMLLLAYLGEKHGLCYSIDELFFNPRPCELAIVGGGEREQRPIASVADALPVLPKELAKWKESDQTEAIYPADAASGLYLFIQESGSVYGRGLTACMRIRLRRTFLEAEFRNKVHCLVKRHPVLRSHFVKDASGNRWQVFDREGAAPVYYRDLTGLSEDTRERFLSGFFQVMDENKSPFQVGCFPVGENSCELLIRLSHTLADGISTRVLVNELAADADPQGTDAFYEYRRRRLAERDNFPKELDAYYAALSGRMRLSVGAGEGGGICRCELVFTKGQTERLKTLCLDLGVTLAAYVEYCYGKGLLAAMNRNELWLSHLYSGREAPVDHCSAIVGNLFYTMPVHLDAGMSAEAFHRELVKPWKYPFVTDTAQYRRLNRHNLEEGIVSRVFMPFHENVVSYISVREGMDTGHYFELAEGALRIVLRYPQDERLDQAYEKVEEVMRNRLCE